VLVFLIEDEILVVKSCDGLTMASTEGNFKEDCRLTTYRKFVLNIKSQGESINLKGL